MRLVHREHYRPALGDGGRQPVETVQRRRECLPVGDGGLRRVAVQGAPRKPGGARKQRLALARGEAAKQALEQFANHAPRQISLQLPAARDRDGDPVAPDALDGALEQHGFADARRPLNERHAAGAARGPPHHPDQRLKLGLPLE